MIGGSLAAKEARDDYFVSGIIGSRKTSAPQHSQRVIEPRKFHDEIREFSLIKNNARNADFFAEENSSTLDTLELQEIRNTRELQNLRETQVPSLLFVYRASMSYPQYQHQHLLVLNMANHSPVSGSILPQLSQP